MRLPSNYRRQYFKITASRNPSFDKTSNTQLSPEASFELQTKHSFRLRRSPEAFFRFTDLSSRLQTQSFLRITAPNFLRTAADTTSKTQLSPEASFELQLQTSFALQKTKIQKHSFHLMRPENYNMRLPSNYRRQYFKNTASRNLSFDKTSKTQCSLEASFELQSKLSFRLRLPSNYSPSKTHRHNFSLLFSFFPLLFSLLSFLRLCPIVLLICPSECCTSSNSALYDLQAP